MAMPRKFYSVAVPGSKQTFNVDARYQNLRYLGGGAYGTVCSAEDALQGNKKVAIKKISEVFRDLFDAKRILREILLLRHLGKGHENLLWLSDVFCWPQPHSHSLASLDVASFRDIYLVTDVLDTDLSRILESKQTLTGQHCKYFCYQLIRGLHYLHSAGVLHRDLKPSNLLVNANCELVIADLGLARPMSGFLAKESAGISRTSRVSRDSSVENEEEGGASGAGGSSSSGVPISAGKTTGLGARAGAGGGEGLTSYVVTRWYRAPELLLQSKTYGCAVDMFSVGCILAEMLGKKVLFPGRSHVDQLRVVLDVIGTPSEEQTKWMAGLDALKALKSMPIKKKVAWTKLFPAADPLALDLLEGLLSFDPTRRLTAAQALAHPYLRDYSDPSDEPVAEFLLPASEFAFDPKRDVTRAELSALMLKEISYFRPGHGPTLQFPAQAPTVAAFRPSQNQQQQPPQHHHDSEARQSRGSRGEEKSSGNTLKPSASAPALTASRPSAAAAAVGTQPTQPPAPPLAAAAAANMTAAPVPGAGTGLNFDLTGGRPRSTRMAAHSLAAKEALLLNSSLASVSSNVSSDSADTVSTASSLLERVSISALAAVRNTETATSSSSSSASSAAAVVGVPVVRGGPPQAPFEAASAGNGASATDDSASGASGTGSNSASTRGTGRTLLSGMLHRGSSASQSQHPVGVTNSAAAAASGSGVPMAVPSASRFSPAVAASGNPPSSINTDQAVPANVTRAPSGGSAFVQRRASPPTNSLLSSASSASSAPVAMMPAGPTAGSATSSASSSSSTSTMFSLATYTAPGSGEATVAGSGSASGGGSFDHAHGGSGGSGGAGRLTEGELAVLLTKQVAAIAATLDQKISAMEARLTKNLDDKLGLLDKRIDRVEGQLRAPPASSAASSSTSSSGPAGSAHGHY